MHLVGRQWELKQLNALKHSGSANLVILTGPRGIGKSRLIEELAKGETLYSFSGLAPNKETTAQTQRDEFIRQFRKQNSLPNFSMTDWGDIFTLLSQHTKQGHIIILLDEISWMGDKDKTFLGKLKNAWDLEFKLNPHLILVLCGSISTWIEKNIVISTEF